uniref:Uncharacterized protein n=1 Tax=Rhizophora mucronata TaxID=61149 RepID=A0A2P2PV46_RHIMU
MLAIESSIHGFKWGTKAADLRNHCQSFRSINLSNASNTG